MRQSLKAAGKHFRAGELEPAQAALKIAKQQLDRLSNDEATQEAAKPLRTSWTKATQLVASKLGDERDKKLEPTKGVSFASDLAPTLVDRCTGCHGADRARAELRVHTLQVCPLVAKMVPLSIRSKLTVA